jgi:hypothetical protein
VLKDNGDFRNFRENAKSDSKFGHFCPSALKKNWAYKWMDFHEICYLIIYRKYAAAVQI